MDKQLIISAVHYLNTKPFLYGLDQTTFRDRMVYSMDTPAECANKLQNGQVALGLVPVAILPQLENAVFIPNWGIGSDGDVASVCLYSQVPLDEIEGVFLDYQSRTSNLLLKILLAEYYGINVQLKTSFPGYEEHIKGKMAGLIIGDRSLLFKNQYRYAFDLAGAWKKLTGLPFVFALWVYQDTLSRDLLSEIDEAFQYGLSCIPTIARDHMQDFNGIDIEAYLSTNIKYKLNEKFIRGMELFFEKCALIPDTI